MSFWRIRVWRTRRKERKAEKVIAVSTTERKTEADRELDDTLNNVAAHVPIDPSFVKHAGEEGKSHY